jgi:hypothetical protein
MAERAGMGRHGGDLDRQEAEATLEARRELGADYEPALVDSFVEKIETAIDVRVDTRMAELRRHDKVEGQRQKQQMALGIVSLGTGIPITALAGSLGDGLPGVLVAWAGIATVNMAYALQGRRR